MFETQVRPASAGASGAARRLSPRARKVVLAAHVLVAVEWFGVVVAKLVLELSAARAADPLVARAAYASIGTLDRATFPPLAVGTMLTGVILCLGTPWGLFRHYWIVVKIALTVAVVATGIAFVGTWLQQAVADVSGAGLAGASGASRRLIGAAVVHALMLAAATAISVFKPWGRIGAAPRGAAVRGAAVRPPE